MVRSDSPDFGIDGLLDLDGEIMEIGDGYWVQFRARRVRVTAARPHGLQYALTLHRPGGRRILGYDNAHSLKQMKFLQKQFRNNKTYDHIHKGENKVVPYEFRTAADLVEDFWNDVDGAIQEESGQ